MIEKEAAAAEAEAAEVETEVLPEAAEASAEAEEAVEEKPKVVMPNPRLKNEILLTCSTLISNSYDPTHSFFILNFFLTFSC